MSNGIYTKFKQGLMNKEYDLDTDILKVALLTSAYTVYLATDTAYSDDALAAQVVTATLLGANITSTPGTFTATDHVFSSVATGNTVTQIVIYESGGDLIAYFDTDAGGSINIPTNNGDITVDWNASGIFSL